MPTNSTFIYDESFTAGADLRTKQYMPVKFSAANTVNVAGAAEAAIGILLNDPNSGEAAIVRMLGQSIAWVDGTVAIAAGDPLECDANNRLVKSTTDKRWALCRAAEAATGVARISVILTGGWHMGV